MRFRGLIQGLMARMWIIIGSVVVVAVMLAFNTVNLMINYTPVYGTVLKVELMCEFRMSSGGSTGVLVRDSCNATPEFAALTKGGTATPDRKLKGDAVITASYVLPADKLQRTSSYKISFSNGGFYRMREGDQITLYVDKRDPFHIRSFTSGMWW